MTKSRNREESDEGEKNIVEDREKVFCKPENGATGKGLCCLSRRIKAKVNYSKLNYFMNGSKGQGDLVGK